MVVGMREVVVLVVVAKVVVVSGTASVVVVWAGVVLELVVVVGASEVVVVVVAVVDFLLEWYLDFFSLLLDSTLNLGSEVTILTINFELCCLLVDDSNERSSGRTVVASAISSSGTFALVVTSGK